MLTVGTRSVIDKFERLDVGAGLTVRGIGRCALSDVGLDANEVFLSATVAELVDDNADDALAARVVERWEQMMAAAKEHNVQIQQDLKVDPRAILVPEDVLHAQRPSLADCDDAETLSFLALDGAKPELKLKALVTRDRTVRLQFAMEEIDRQLLDLNTKLVLNSLQLPEEGADDDDDVASQQR